MLQVESSHEFGSAPFHPVCQAGLLATGQNSTLRRNRVLGSKRTQSAGGGDPAPAGSATIGKLLLSYSRSERSNSTSVRI
jgi:hypothetical protein